MVQNNYVKELSKLRLDYVSINVTENEARDNMSQNYIEAMMKNMGQVTGRITARELNLKNDVLQNAERRVTKTERRVTKTERRVTNAERQHSTT